MATNSISVQHPASPRTLWLRWVGANALSEAVGLGLTLALTGVVIARLGDTSGIAAVLISFAAAVLSGLIEATFVGVSQYWAMGSWFPSITQLGWWKATLVGALLAYFLGYLPSTILNLVEVSEPAAAPVSEPPQAVVLLLAAGLGAVAGAILSFFQARELRKSVGDARSWIPANMLAWAVGMPVIFAAIDRAFLQPERWAQVLLMAIALLLMGAIVGAIHGLALVRLAPRAS